MSQLVSGDGQEDAGTGVDLLRIVCYILINEQHALLCRNICGHALGGGSGG